MSWHVDEAVIDDYQEGTLPRPIAASVELHVTGCGTCRDMVPVDRARLEQSWAAVAGRVEPSRQGLAERGMTVLGVPNHIARIVAVSPAMRASFVLAVALAMGFAVVAANSNPVGDSYKIFLAMAPLLPVAGIGFAYGRLVDPSHELTMASPIDSLRLLLLRAATVLGVSVAVGLVAWPLVPAPSTSGPSAWLVPAFTLTLLTLALASRVEVWLAGAMVASGWVALMVAAIYQPVDTFDLTAQFGYATVAIAAAATVLVRRNQYDREGRRR